MKAHCTPMTGYLCKDGVLEEHFPYVTRGAEGEFIIPQTHIEEFVVKFLELRDKTEHLERLKLYRAQGARPGPDEIGD